MPRSIATMRPLAMPMSIGPSAGRSESRALRMTRSTDQSLLGFDVGGLDQRPPLVDLLLVMDGERLRALLLARRNLLAEAGQPLAHRRIGEGIHGGGGE